MSPPFFNQSKDTLNDPPTMMPPLGEEDVETSEKIDGAFMAIQGATRFDNYNGSRPTKLLNKSGESLETFQTDVNAAQSFASPLKSAYESDALKTIRDGVNALADSLPGLLEALDEVAQLHPFVAIAVSAFRVVIELDMKRRDNDKKIEVLFVEMRDMMEVLLQLRTVKDEETAGPNGMPIEARMQALIKQTAEDIKACANACDTYAKKKLIVKVIKSSAWDSNLKRFIDLFAKRRKDFILALSIHVGVAADDAKHTLRMLDAKIDLVLENFANIVSSEQVALAALVQKRGGPTAVMGDDDALKELLKFRRGSNAAAGKRGDRGDRDGALKSRLEGDDLAAVKQELFDSPEHAIRKNMEVFERKFKMQQRVFGEEMRRMVHHEGDRVIEAVASGPHDKIIDPDIHEIWKEMRWPGHVKARHFVLALRDYYRQQIENKKRRFHGEEQVMRVIDKDEWALEWISIHRLQAIAEAFDDDASGFITIAEVNSLTSSRPKDWSLSRWLAYWAIGWQMTATYYREKIDHLYAKMFAIRPLILPANRNAVNKYLATVWKSVCTLTSSTETTSQSDTLKKHFKRYVEAEEQRIREGLETVRYGIDAMDTLTLITGPGRIEKHLMPLIYLLLKRDFEIFRLCRTMVIHNLELSDSACNLHWLSYAVESRYNDLQAFFKQQQLDPATQFKNIASGLFDYWHDYEKFWSLDNLRTTDFLELEYNDADEAQDVDIGKILNYPSAAVDLYAIVEDIITESDAQADEAVRMILGRWYALLGGHKRRWAAAPMMTFSFHASANHNTYEASGPTVLGPAFTILGGYKTDNDGSVKYSFASVLHTLNMTTYWQGTLADEGQTLTGTWGYSEDDTPWSFLCKRVAPDVLVARPPPAEFAKSRVRALWKYALTAAHDEARRKLFSWSYLKQRRDIRREYLELVQREDDGLATSEDVDRFSVLNHTTTYADARCFSVLHDYHQRLLPQYFGVICGVCSEHIYGARMVCMECGSQDTFDFCDKAACLDQPVQKCYDPTAGHRPSHNFVKIRAAIFHYREIGGVFRKAEVGLEFARKLLAKAAKGPEAAQKTSTDSVVRFPVMELENLKKGEPDLVEVLLLNCISCHASVSQPCWFCIDCPETSHVFVCYDCDAREGGITVQDHQSTHSLVRCIDAKRKTGFDEKVENVKGAGVEKRLTAVEGQLSALTAQMDRIEKVENGVEEQLTTVEGQLSALTGQMDRIEKLMQTLAVTRVEG